MSGSATTYIGWCLATGWCWQGLPWRRRWASKRTRMVTWCRTHSSMRLPGRSPTAIWGRTSPKTILRRRRLAASTSCASSPDMFAGPASRSATWTCSSSSAPSGCDLTSSACGQRRRSGLRGLGQRPPLSDTLSSRVWPGPPLDLRRTARPPPNARRSSHPAPGPGGSPRTATAVRRAWHWWPSAAPPCHRSRCCDRR